MSEQIPSEQNQTQQDSQPQPNSQPQPINQSRTVEQPQPAAQPQQASQPQPIAQPQQANQPRPIVQSQPTYSSAQQAQAGTSGLAITGLVLGVVAILGSFLPIINNAAFFIGIVGLVLSIIGLRQTKSGAKKGSGMAIAGIVLCIISLIVTLLVQAACSAALDSMTSNGKGTVAGASSSATASNGNKQADTANMQVGQTIDMENGLSVTVNAVEGGLESYGSSTISRITVTYVNNGKSNASFNMLDWKAEDANGAQRSVTYSADDNNLNSGTLSPGGTVTGNIYFEDPIVKVYYYSNILSDTSNIAWIVG